MRYRPYEAECETTKNISNDGKLKLQLRLKDFFLGSQEILNYFFRDVVEPGPWAARQVN